MTQVLIEATGWFLLFILIIAVVHLALKTIFFKRDDDPPDVAPR